MIGTTISHFRILDLLGKGGMGEVYLAEDTTLNRQVAIKVLPELLAHDPERLARFEREAKLLATLNHPNIAAIYGLEEADGKRLLILELVEGETLAERIKKGPIPVEEALHLALQITEGLEAAHEKGIIHRDLKPGNIKLTPEGKVKILDFGLAKAFEEETSDTDASHSPTLTDQMTHAGVILGTAAYMSPEQAKGKTADRRADIWAFGAVLYEMLTGKRAFEGDTITVTLGAIIHKEPDWEALPEGSPWRVRDLLCRCLRKDANRRLHDIADARIDIEESISEPTSLTPSTIPALSQPGWMRAIPWGLLAIMTIVAGGAIWALTRPTQPRPPVQFAIGPPPGAELANLPGRNELAISRDGRRIIYGALGHLYLRRLDELAVSQISGTEDWLASFFFSPDGNSVAFFTTGDQLKKVSLVGGTPLTLCSASGGRGSRAGSWVGDTIVFGDGRGIHRVSAAGGEPQPVILDNADNENELYFTPETLPGGEAVLLTSFVPARGPEIVVVSLETGEKKVLVEGGKEPRYAPSGHLIYELSGTGTLMAAPFNLDTLELTSEPVPVLEGVRQSSNGRVDYAISNEGTLVYIPTVSNVARSLVWVDRVGRETLLTQEKRAYELPRLSPDGKQIGLGIINEEGNRNILIYDVEEEFFRSLTFEGNLNGPLVWTPDGNSVIFRAPGIPGNLFRRLADGSRPAERLTESENNQVPTSILPDGSVLVFHEARPETSRDILILPIEGEGEAQLLITSPELDCCARFSPDGRWLAYVSAETSRLHVYVSPYPEADVKYPISGEEGGGAPVWSPDGKELFYRSGEQMERMMVVSVQTEPAFSVSGRRMLFEGDYMTSWALPGASGYYDVSPDGERFLMIRQEQSGAQINVVLNWFEEIERLAPTD